MIDNITEIEYIIKHFKNNDISIENDQAEKLYLFYKILIEKNTVINLTAITEFKDVVDKHFVDSAILTKYVDLNEKNIIDIGTGAGFPGIPLKIIHPDLNVTLLDSLNKRIVFLNEVIEALNLENITTIHSRAEELAQKNEYREKYDIAVSRAVSNLSTLVEYCLPFVKVHGSFYSYKSSKALGEINEASNAIKTLGGIVVNNFNLQIFGTDYERSIIEIKKNSTTPKKYPRGGNKPLSNPIK
ncbi:MAG: 16S rRNA (guanine(527)-N(7))-methyltransferase RsmG [Lachnospiraceae bacterium]|nr:16S rRNA (guanine(527)-N(7))-methyltransferase RsmG [Lachnospiraceae bacterium]